jgi:hypothetical protein
MLIEVGTKWSSNRSYEFKVSIVWNPKTKTKDKHCWYFVPCIKIKENGVIEPFNRKLVQQSPKLINSYGRLEGWGGDGSLQWMFMGWHMSSKL